MKRECTSCGETKRIELFSTAKPNTCKLCRAWASQKNRNPNTNYFEWEKQYKKNVAHLAMIKHIREQGKKYCWKCKQALELSAFNKAASTSDGLQSACAECNKQINRERRDKRNARVGQELKLYKPGRFDVATMRM